MANYLVTVSANLAGRYALPPVTYRPTGSDPGIAARRAWNMFKKQPSLKRKRLDNICIKVVRI